MRICDPFPNVAIVLARVLFGSEVSLDLLQRPVSSETASMDELWLPPVLKGLQAQLQQYPARSNSTPGAADIVYNSSREVLKSAFARLLEFQKKISAAPG